MAASISSIAQTQDLTSQTTYTFSSQSLGAASPDRVIAVQFNARKSGTTFTVTAATIDGITVPTANIIQATNTVTNSDLSAIFFVSVPNTDTTGTITITLSAAAVRSSIAVYKITTINPIVYDSSTSTANAPTASIKVPAGGVALAVAQLAVITTTTWIGLTKDYDTTISTFTTYSGASLASSGDKSPLTITATFATGTTEPVGVFVSFSEPVQVNNYQFIKVGNGMSASEKIK